MSFILTASDMSGSVLQLTSPESGITQAKAYSAYGDTEHTAGNTRVPGFNGERRDPGTGASHLGNGYRAYSPVLMRFNCPDSMSPFGAGGINPYAYCAGDPVNNSDPSGHMSIQGGMGIGLGGLGLSLGIVSLGLSTTVTRGTAAVLMAGMAASATSIVSGAASENSDALGWLSLATGLVGLTLTGYGATKVLSNSALSARLNAITTLGLSGRGAPRAAEQWQTAGLLRLPNEILENITYRLDNSSLAALGATNRRLHSIVSRPRAKRTIDSQERIRCYIDQYGMGEDFSLHILQGLWHSKELNGLIPDAFRPLFGHYHQDDASSKVNKPYYSFSASHGVMAKGQPISHHEAYGWLRDLDAASFHEGKHRYGPNVGKERYGTADFMLP